jgi:hypothetical protein
MLLYKFLNAKTAIKVMNDHKIRFSQLSALNDPFESFPSIDGLVTRDWVSQVLEDYLSDDSAFDKILNDTISRAYERTPIVKLMFPNKEYFSLFLKRYIQNEFSMRGSNLRETILGDLQLKLDTLTANAKQDVLVMLSNIVCVLSLSTAKNNPLLWVHYADSHSGVAIGFNTNNTFFSEIAPVKYLSERPHLSINRATATDSDMQCFARRILTMKNISWSYEEEYRLVKLNSMLELSNELDQRGLPVFLSTFPIESVAQIIYGCRISPDDQSSLDLIISQRYSNVQRFVSIINPKEFQISFQSIG